MDFGKFPSPPNDCFCHCDCQCLKCHPQELSPYRSMQGQSIEEHNHIAKRLRAEERKAFYQGYYAKVKRPLKKLLIIVASLLSPIPAFYIPVYLAQFGFFLCNETKPAPMVVLWAIGVMVITVLTIIVLALKSLVNEN